MDIPVDLTTTFLNTTRLVLRPFRETDINDFYEYASVPGVGEMAGWPHHKSIDESSLILKMFIDEKNVLAIVCKENGKVIGSLGLHESPLNANNEYSALTIKDVGYVLSKDYWGRGLVPEAVREIIRFCFENLGLDALSVGHFDSNSQSRRVIEKCGFKFVQNQKFHSNLMQQNFDEMVYAMLKSDWINKIRE